ncbi:MAG TPA: hypothetical protein VMK65_11950 [Longimicrobiales bacterium]|nr:hypothetical protein [Longimicrobiales bacterium]
MADITIERKPKRRVWPLLHVLLVLALGAAAWWLFGGGQETFAGDQRDVPAATEEGYAPNLAEPERATPGTSTPPSADRPPPPRP